MTPFGAPYTFMFSGFDGEGCTTLPSESYTVMVTVTGVEPLDAVRKPGVGLLIVITEGEKVIWLAFELEAASVPLALAEPLETGLSAATEVTPASVTNDGVRQSKTAMCWRAMVKTDEQLSHLPRRSGLGIECLLLAFHSYSVV